MRTRIVWVPQSGRWWVERFAEGRWFVHDGYIAFRWWAWLKAWRLSFRGTTTTEFYNGVPAASKHFEKAEFMREGME